MQAHTWDGTTVYETLMWNAYAFFAFILVENIRAFNVTHPSNQSNNMHPMYIYASNLPLFIQPIKQHAASRLS
jgi:hypothetical protein